MIASLELASRSHFHNYTKAGSTHYLHPIPQKIRLPDPNDRKIMTMTYLANFYRRQITPHISDESSHGRIKRQPSALNQSFAFSWLEFRWGTLFSAKCVRLDVCERPRVQHNSLVIHWTGHSVVLWAIWDEINRLQHLPVASFSNVFT